MATEWKQAFEYRLYVGLPNGPDDWRRLISIVKGTLAAATVQSGTGIWKDDDEYTAIITVVIASGHARETARRIVDALAADLRAVFNQDCVMVTEHEIERAFVS